MPEISPQVLLAPRPDRIVCLLDDEDPEDAALMASNALDLARTRMPRVTSHLATTLQAIHAANFFGLYFPDRVAWYQEQGTRPFTMHSLQGKIIPMWIDDPTGKVRRENPKAQVRRTDDGRTQVKIFRSAGVRGQRKTVTRVGRNGVVQRVSVPVSYPGAPGRIGRREAPRPLTRPGAAGGQVARGNIGVRWRHPGITARMFLNSAITDIALAAGVQVDRLYLCDEATFFGLVGL